MTDSGKAFVKQRLIDAPNLDALARVWASIGREYQMDADVKALKDRLKAGFK